MFTLAVIRRAIRLTATALALLLAATSLSPAVSGAQPNQGGGTDNADYCQTMLERIGRYHKIADDPSQPQAVRDFYRARAAATLLRAQLAGCDYTSAAVRGDVVAPGTFKGASARRAKAQRRAFGRLRPTTRSAKRTTSGGGSHTPHTAAAIAEIKANPSGSPKQDQYCADVAKLIDEAEAEAEADRALLDGDAASAAAWYDLADYFLDQATQNGCRFVFLKRAALTPVDAVLQTRR